MGLSGLSGNSGLGGIVPGGIPWLPTMESSLILWIDPLDTTGWTLNASGNPTVMRSKASTQDAFTLVAGAAPVLTGGAILVTDTATRFSTPSVLGLSADPNLLVAGVFDPDNANFAFLFEVGSDSNRIGLIIRSNDYSWRYGSANALFPAVNADNPVLIAATRFTGSDRLNDSIRADGTSLAAGLRTNGLATTSGNITQIFPGSWIGTLSEILSFSSTSQALIQRVEGYLAWRHGRVGALPADHPYKLARPIN